MLLLTVAAAVAVQWWLRPQPQEVELKGGLRMRLQTLTETRQNQYGGQSEVMVRDGTFRLLDADGRTLAKGRYSDDLADGHWTYYYTDGARSAAGDCRRGARVGMWRAWHPNGRRKDEIRYGEPALYLAKVDPHDEEAVRRAPRITVREGPAAAWYDNGQLRWKGAFLLGRRHGRWTMWNRGGKLVATGRYEGGRRHGPWTVDRGRGPQSEHYWFGKLQPSPEAVTREQLREAITGNEWLRRRSALETAAARGELSVLAEALQGPPDGALSALRALGRMGAAASGQRSAVEALTKHSDSLLRATAWTTLLAISPGDRTRAADQLAALDPRRSAAPAWPPSARWPVSRWTWTFGSSGLAAATGRPACSPSMCW